MAKNIFYLKLNDEKVYLTDDGININEGLYLTFRNDGYTIEDIQSLFSGIAEGITIHGCILQDDGTETDEFIASHYDQYPILQSITHDNDQDLYTVRLVTEPIEENEEEE